MTKLRERTGDAPSPMEFFYCGRLHAVCIVARDVLRWSDRMRFVRFFEDSLALSSIKRVLVDLSGLSKSNDPDEALRLRDVVRGKIEAFRGRNIAVVRSTGFPLSSATVQVLRQRGVDIREFETAEDAKEWLTSLAERDLTRTDAERLAVSDAPVRLWP